MWGWSIRAMAWRSAQNRARMDSEPAVFGADQLDRHAPLDGLQFDRPSRPCPMPPSSADLLQQLVFAAMPAPEWSAGG